MKTRWFALLILVGAAAIGIEVLILFGPAPQIDPSLDNATDADPCVSAHCIHALTTVATRPKPKPKPKPQIEATPSVLTAKDILHVVERHYDGERDRVTPGLTSLLVSELRTQTSKDVLSLTGETLKAQGVVVDVYPHSYRMVLHRQGTARKVRQSQTYTKSPGESHWKVAPVWYGKYTQVSGGCSVVVLLEDNDLFARMDGARKMVYAYGNIPCSMGGFLARGQSVVVIGKVQEVQYITWPARAQVGTFTVSLMLTDLEVSLELIEEADVQNEREYYERTRSARDVW